MAPLARCLRARLRAAAGCPPRSMRGSRARLLLAAARSCPHPPPPVRCRRLPALLALKQRLAEAGEGYSSVFMTGSGSTIVCMGSGARPGRLPRARGCRPPAGLGCLPPAGLPLFGGGRRARLNRRSLPLPVCNCRGAESVPSFLQAEAQYADLFVTPARLITRQPGQWYAAPARPSTATAAEAAAAAAVKA